MRGNNSFGNGQGLGQGRGQGLGNRQSNGQGLGQGLGQGQRLGLGQRIGRGLGLGRRQGLGRGQGLGQGQGAGQGFGQGQRLGLGQRLRRGLGFGYTQRGLVNNNQANIEEQSLANENNEVLDSIGGHGRNNGGACGTGGYTVCPKCGTRVPHERGVKSTTLKCPNCGAIMVREELLNRKKEQQINK